MVLSLSHLASGIELITGDRDGWQSWMMAVVVDAGFVALELGMIFAHLERTKKVVVKYARPTIFVLMLGSAALNALAFGWQAQGNMIYGAVVLGVVVPVLVWVLTKCGVALWSR